MIYLIKYIIVSPEYRFNFIYYKDHTLYITV